MKKKLTLARESIRLLSPEAVQRGPVGGQASGAAAGATCICEPPTRIVACVPSGVLTGCSCPLG